MKIRSVIRCISIFAIGILAGCGDNQTRGLCGTVPAIDRSVSAGAEYAAFEQTLSPTDIHSKTPDQLNSMFETVYCPANTNPPGWNSILCANCPVGVTPNAINRVEVISCNINHTVPIGLVRPVTSSANGVYAYYQGCKLPELTDVLDDSADQ